MGHQVFISHAASNKVVADAMLEKLEEAGIRCWIAPRDIRPGDSWGGAIVRAIEASQILIVILSQKSNASHQVLREVERAVQKDVVLLPFRIEEVVPSEDLEYFLSTTHWQDAFAGDFERHLDDLVESARTIIAQRASLGNAEQESASITPHTDAIRAEPNSEEEVEIEEEKDSSFELDPPSLLETSEPVVAKETQATQELEQTPAARNNQHANSLEKSSAKSVKSAATQGQRTEPSLFDEPVDAKAEFEKGDFVVSPEDIAPAIDHAQAQEEANDSLEPVSPQELESDEKHKEQDETSPAIAANESDEVQPNTSLTLERSSRSQKRAGNRGLILFAGLLLAGLGGAWFAHQTGMFGKQGSATEVVDQVNKKPITTDQSLDGAQATSKPAKPQQQPNKNDLPLRETETAAENQSPVQPSENSEAQSQAGDSSETQTAQQAASKQAKEEAEKRAAAEALAKQQFEQRAKLRKLARVGDAQAAMDIGGIYERGEGVSVNLSKAAEWYSMALEKNHPQAQFKIGQLTIEGRGVSKDVVSGMALLTASAEQGNVDAQNFLGQLYEKGELVTQDYETAATYYQAAVDQGSAIAQRNLGVMYEFGLGVGQNAEKALALYLAAAEQGDAKARVYADQLSGL